MARHLTPAKPSAKCGQAVSPATPCPPTTAHLSTWVGQHCGHSSTKQPCKNAQYNTIFQATKLFLLSLIVLAKRPYVSIYYNLFKANHFGICVKNAIKMNADPAKSGFVYPSTKILYPMSKQCYVAYIAQTERTDCCILTNFSLNLHFDQIFRLKCQIVSSTFYAQLLYRVFYCATTAGIEFSPPKTLTRTEVTLQEY